MTLILLIATLFQIQHLESTWKTEPFPITMRYSSEAPKRAARLEILADFEKLDISEVSIRNHTSDLAYEISPLRATTNLDRRPWQFVSGRLVILLEEIFPNGMLPYGSNIISVAVRAENGDRVILDRVEMIIQ